MLSHEIRIIGVRLVCLFYFMQALTNLEVYLPMIVGYQFPDSTGMMPMYVATIVGPFIVSIVFWVLAPWIANRLSYIEPASAQGQMPVSIRECYLLAFFMVGIILIGNSFPRLCSALLIIAEAGKFPDSTGNPSDLRSCFISDAIRVMIGLLLMTSQRIVHKLGYGNK